ncbi:MAG: class I SAM-dependent methyltransferase [Verrucomicrobia bacterium]|nr:class I SAM-dependent methyltransferase [Verrucomicrobiota bacterium]
MANILPQSKAGEKEHRRQKRELEISLAIETLSGLAPAEKLGRLNVLEFGSGDGFQIPFLQKLGPAVASDVYTSEDIRRRPDIEFHETSITRTPFRDGQFDVIYSNHVMEHIEDMAAACAELRRIGAPGCLYAFSVPTHHWLLFDVPSQYYNKARALLGKFVNRKPPARSAAKEDEIYGKAQAPRRSFAQKLASWILPNGHGVNGGFLACHRAFKPASWRKLFEEHGFEILRAQPLLRYASSEWPLVPTARVADDARVFSSILFVLRRK